MRSFRDTHFSAKVSIFIGIVALDVDVEKAKAITGKKFLIKIIGFNPEKSLTLTYKPQNIEHLKQAIHRTYILIMG